MPEVSQTAGILQKAYAELRSGSLDGAKSFLEEALTFGYEDGEVLFSWKCLLYWEDRVAEAMASADPFERGNLLLSGWNGFRAFADRASGGIARDDALYAFRIFIFGRALSAFESIGPDGQAGDRCETDFRLGLCHKGLGRFEEATAFLDKALKAKRDSARFMSELADCYALVNETRVAKALIREAFYIRPEEIGLSGMESHLIRELIDRVSALGHSGADLARWIPVYGVVWGVFSVKRELRPIEFSLLKQAVFQLENEVKLGGDKAKEALPALLYRYFWLIDHFLAMHEDRSRVDEVLLKIKLLSPEIHKLYLM